MAVGLYVAGKDDCKCSPLVAAGIVPDSLNTLSELPIWSALRTIVERMAAEFRVVFGQVGAAPALAAVETEAKPTAKAEPEPVAKPKKEKKQKKVKRPPTAR
jgi:hypothetical protein